MIAGYEQHPVGDPRGALIMITLFLPLLIHVAVADVDATYGPAAVENNTFIKLIISKLMRTVHMI